jgi:very-short-patch-repair endonuclease
MAQSPIEKKFASRCKTMGLKVEAEQRVGRYRPDFIVRDQKLAIELDGHDTHASVEDRIRDGQRQRYLQRLGWTVLRFTGREIQQDVEACVAEVMDFVSALGTPTPSYAIYIDWLYFQRAVVDFERRSAAHLAKSGAISRDSFLQILPRVIDMPELIAVHLFGTASTFSDSACTLEPSRVMIHEGRRFVVAEHQASFLAVELLDHLKAHRPTYQDRIVLVADDGAYPPEFLDEDPHLAALIRDGEDRSRMMTIRAAKWQDIDYLFAPIVGVPLHELI